MNSGVRPFPAVVTVPRPSELAPADLSMPELELPSPSEGPPTISPSRAIALRITLAISALLVVWVLWPYWGWLVLAAWFAALARPMLDRISRFCGGRRRAAAIITIGLSIVIFVPIAAVLASLAEDAVELVGTLLSASSGSDALRDLAVQGDHGETTVLVRPEQVREFAQSHVDMALGLALSVTGTLLQGLFGLMVLFSGAYVMLVRGPALFDWLEGFAPASHRTMIRLRDAFIETGRGLLIGSGMTGLVQAMISTAIYLALGVPRALVLGFLTLVASLIPGVGTALVWVPLSIGLALAGRMPTALLLAVLGTVFVAAPDNFIRPFFVRWGKLALSPFVVMVSVFGGLAAMGPWGMLFGPIVIRLALEILRISREEQVV
jgi:predicted PurR-regulated permease PerM